jgi:GMP synthase (glutamine-hydrolysing)
MGLVKRLILEVVSLSELAGVSDPETKRKIIGRVLLKFFDDESHLMKE